MLLIEDMTRYASLRIAPAKSFGQGLKNIKIRRRKESMKNPKYSKYVKNCQKKTLKSQKIITFTFFPEKSENFENIFSSPKNK